jgi:hypothetical protein
MRTLFLLLLLVHGLIHLMGFLKAFGLAELPELTLPVSRGWGVMWLAASLLLVSSGIFWITGSSEWWIPALAGVILSQVLLFAFWQDARFGTLPNVIILTVLVVGIIRHSPPTPEITDRVEPVHFAERYGSGDAGGISSFYNPFTFLIEPMEGLLLINIENDPDSIYIGFEPQVFDDEKTGTGLLVIAWRTDGKVDVYHQPSLRLDPAGYDIAGKGLENMVAREMEGAFFEVNEMGAQAAATFEDIDGRLIELKLSEQSTRTRKQFGLLAPMGVAAENPSAMPVILMHDFYFVRRSGSEISVTIAGRSHQSDNLPLPIDFTRMTFARYSPDPLITKLNPAFEGVLTPVQFDSDMVIQHDNHRIDLILNEHLPEIRKISRSHKQHTLAIAFEPAFPNLAAFNGERAEGRFEISGDASTGFIRGEYSVTHSGDRLQIVMVPSGGWIPNESKLSIRFLYRVESMFKEWPKTYRWTADLERTGEAGFRMTSNWERTNNTDSR